MAPRFFSERQLDTTPGVAPRQPNRGLAAGLNQVGDALTVRQRQIDAVYVTERDAEMRQRFATEFDSRAADARGASPTFTDDLLADFDAWRDNIKDAPSATARETLMGRAVGFRGQLATRANGFQIARATQHQSSLLARAIEKTSNAIRSDGSQYEAARETLLADLALAGETLPGGAMAILTEAAEQTMASAAIRFGIDEDPTAALAVLHAGDYDERLSAAQKNTLINQANAEIDRRRRLAEAEAALNRGAYRDEAKDYVAYLRSGGTEADDQFSVGALLANLGAEEGKEFAESIDRSWAFGSDAAVIQDGTPEDAAAILLERQAGLSDHEDFRVEQADFLDLVGLREAAVKARDDDPGAMALRTPAVRGAYDALLAARAAGNGPEWAAAAQDYARVNQAEQERRGTPRHLRRVLPNADIDEWGRLIGEATPAEAASLLGQFNRHWGQDGLSQLGGALALESPALGIAANSAAYDPRMSSQIIDGLRILKENTELRPKPLEIEGRLQEVYGSLFEVNPEVRPDFREAAVALYARGIAGRADSDIFDSELFDRELSRVGGALADGRGGLLGGPFTYGGRVVLPLRPGEDQDTWLRALHSLDDAAMREYGNGLPTTSVGGRVSLRDLASMTSPVSIGFGRYMFFIEGLGYVGTDNPDAPVFMVDLLQFHEERGAGFRPLEEIEGEFVMPAETREQLMERLESDRIPDLTDPPIARVPR